MVGHFSKSWFGHGPIFDSGQKETPAQKNGELSFWLPFQGKQLVPSTEDTPKQGSTKWVVLSLSLFHSRFPLFPLRASEKGPISLRSAKAGLKTYFWRPTLAGLCLGGPNRMHSKTLRTSVASVGCGSKPCTSGEHQRRWHRGVHPPQKWRHRL